MHEHRFTALVVLVERYRRAGPEERAALSRLYLEHRAGVDNWDLVDVSARDLLGGELIEGAHEAREVLDDLAGAERVWDRRIAVVATHALIVRGRFDETLALAQRLLEDPHPLIRKAVGWMLREIGKRDEGVLLGWLETHRRRMPRTMLRSAVERLAPARRAALMARTPAQPGPKSSST